MIYDSNSRTVHYKTKNTTRLCLIYTKQLLIFSIAILLTLSKYKIIYKTDFDYCLLLTDKLPNMNRAILSMNTSINPNLKL